LKDYQQYMQSTLSTIIKECFKAFTAIVTYRNESIRRIDELKGEIDDLINEVEKELRNYRVQDEQKYDRHEVFFELKPYLESLKDKPNNRLWNIFKEILEHEGLYFDCEINRTIIGNVEGYLDSLYRKSYDLNKVIIIKSTAALFIDEIIDLGAPFEFKGKTTHAFIRSLFPNKEINLPTKDTIYEWYGQLKTESDNKAEAFDKLQTEIAAQGLESSEYYTTDDPDNFDKAYREWLKRNLRK